VQSSWLDSVAFYRNAGHGAVHGTGKYVTGSKECCDSNSCYIPLRRFKWDRDKKMLSCGKVCLHDELGLLQWLLPFEKQSMLLEIENDKKSGHAGLFFKSENEK
jgi:hypothetical protein